MLRKTLREIIEQGLEGLRPSTYYRNQHPELFSDSEVAQHPVLERDLFMFHLEQLTTNKREKEFENFARRLCEHEICPNLLPQTGPIGGGDSRTDSSTYPVADEIANRRWWIGHTRPTNEDWAFAFSCKHDWRSKVRDDIKKIAELAKGFTRAFFVTNQPVKDKTRAELETRLSAEFDINVRIMDRTWIVERVYTNSHEILAVESLGLQIGLETKRKLGPNDCGREDELQSLLNKLRSGSSYKYDDYALSQDYLHAAKLASSLDKPRDQVDGLFLRARELAISSRHIHAIVKAYYTHAWRSYFWYDDAVQTERILELMLPILPDISDAEILEQFSNICSILETANQIKLLPREKSILDQRRAKVNERLEAQVKDKARQNNSLYAETLLITRSIHESIRDSEEMERLFLKLSKILQRAIGLGTYPIFKFLDTWQEMGEFFCDFPGYSELQKTMREITASRYGDTAAGRQQLKFGWQLLEKKRFGEAITELSAARFLLAKEETLDESVAAAMGCSSAYLQLGHKWAARMETLCAAHIALNTMERFHHHPRRGYHIALRMAWLELELGRISPFLAWRQFTLKLFSALQARELDLEEDFEELERQDGCFACLLLKVPKDEVIAIKPLIYALEEMGLYMAKIAILHVCDDQAALLHEMQDGLKDNPDFIYQLITKMKGEPAFDQVPSNLSVETIHGGILAAELLGVKYEIRFQSSFGAALIAEGIIGMLDAAFALAKWQNFAIIYENVRIFVSSSAKGENPPVLRQPFNPMVELDQLWKDDVEVFIRTSRGQLSEYLRHLLTLLLASITIDSMIDLKAEISRWQESGVFDRALLAVDSNIALCDLVGEKYYNLNFWFNVTE